MRRVLLVFATLLFLAFAANVNATLIDRGGGMIYSTDLDITWLQDANYARTSSYDADGLMTWSDANTWATNLSYGGYNDWRLPTFDPAYNRDTSTVQSEIAYLRFVELGPSYGSSTPFNPSPFVNLGDTNEPWYWSGSLDGPSNAWRFDFW